jgi:bisanhydrobacterioruberin hydratase
MKTLIPLYNTQVSLQKWIQIVASIYAVGALGFLIPATRPLFIWLTPFNLLFATILLFVFHGKPTGKEVAVYVFIFMGSIGAEIAGVHTGIVFGNYHYGSTLGPSVWGVPWLIGSNWVLLIYTTHQLAKTVLQGVHKAVQQQPPAFAYKIICSVLGALFMVLYDIVLEPVAIRTDMWHWQTITPPLQNYIAWFVLALLLHVPYAFLHNAQKNNEIALPILGFQFLFFTILTLSFVFIL